jgi:hypothetical protein
MDFETKAIISRAQFCPPIDTKTGLEQSRTSPVHLPLEAVILRHYYPIVDPYVVDHVWPNFIGLIAMTDTDGQSDYRDT